LRIPVQSQERSPLQAVVFDMDGVIVDSHPAHRYAWKAFLRTLGKEVTERELDFVMDGRKRRDILFHFLGPLTDEQLKEYGESKDEFFWRAIPDVAPIPGVLDFIGCIRGTGIALAVATSASAGRTRSILESIGLVTDFSAIVTGDEIREGKPDPAVYRVACQRLNCLPEAAVAIEDAPSGVLAAKRAGLKCVGVASHQRAEELTAAGADCVIRDFCNLSLQQLCCSIGMQSALASPTDR